MKHRTKLVTKASAILWYGERYDKIHEDRFVMIYRSRDGSEMVTLVKPVAHSDTQKEPTT